MTTLGIDEDWSKADPVALYAAGYRFAVGYVSQDTTGKNITRDQVDSLHRAHLAVGLVYEYWAQSALGGAGQGTSDAGIAIDHARQLGAPAGVCLYAAVDWNVSTAQLPTVVAYARAFQTACVGAGYRAGVYGSYGLCQYLAQSGYSGLLWQTYAWSGGLWWPGAVLRQEQNGVHVAGATVDMDEAMTLDWGQWEAQMSGEADAAFSQVYTGTEPWISGQSWMAKAVEARLVAIVAKLDQVLTAVSTPTPLVMTPADVQQFAAAVVAAHPALGDADQPAIEAALRSVLHGA